MKTLGVAREILPPRNSSSWQLGTLGSQVDQFCTIREPVTARSQELVSYLGMVSKVDDCFCEAATPANASDGRALAKPERSPGRSKAEGKCSPHTAVMTCTPVKNDFEMPAHNRGVKVGHTISKRARQLTELRVLKPETQIQADKRWDPKTAAVNNLDGAAIEEMLIDIE